MWTFNALIKAHCHADSLGGALKARQHVGSAWCTSSGGIVRGRVYRDRAFVDCHDRWSLTQTKTGAQNNCLPFRRVSTSQHS